ncbi:methyl-accepting chemotaxis protein [Undibacter mobilis]|uniref:HAMP domain-containing protein n=1 Tax=Undibacter mobilis TaxID=2292256 RepID=A0A371BCZ1_9BRAD|nr:methyl-accepting chemotaxis protein [Undibacter mobilis]RDV05367.1 HAMP domain-containing protein [Undibacter mobilis]
MLKLSNISIGLKLSMMSGLGILFAVGLIVGQIMGSSSVRSSTDLANMQADILQGATATESNLRSLQLAVRDVRLSRSLDQMQAAVTTLEERRKTSHDQASSLLPKFAKPENRARFEEIIATLDQYAKDAKVIVDFRRQMIEAQARQDAAQATEFDGKQLAAAKVSLATAERINALVAEARKAAVKTKSDRMIEAQDTADFANRISVILGVLTISILIAAALMGAMTIARPLREMVKPLDEIAAGNFTVKVPNTDRKDEVGQIAASVRQMAEKVRETIAEIKASGREVTNASAEISTSTTDLSQRTEEQAASLEETSAAMEELTSTVRRNAENAQEASRSANETRDVADLGGKVVARTVEAMAKIEESSQKITDIIGVIDEIARQTNLLALNAAVEAARAGEAGRGFAVVASEVRSLAQRSSQAAKDIKDLITNSSVQVKEGVDLVNQAGTSLNDIVTSIKKVAEIVTDIANASIEQATGIDQINKALTQMDEVTQQNSALVEENAATAKTLEHQAKMMDEQVAFFQLGQNDRTTVRSTSAIETEIGGRAPAAKPAIAKVVPAKPASAKPTAPKSVVQLKHTGTGGALKKIETASADTDWKEF